MHKFTWIQGRLTEVQRYINVPARWYEEHPARERRELWLSATQGGELKFVVHTHCMPVRAGHDALLVLRRGRLVALHNITTDTCVNFARSDPPRLWPQTLHAVLVLLLVGALALWAMGWILASASAILLAGTAAPCAVLLGALRSRRAMRATDLALESARLQALSRPWLRRVK